MKGTSFGIFLLAFGATCASTRVLADDLLGFYVGAAIGESHVRTAKEILADWSTNFAYGAGVQGKIGSLAIRAEYERIGGSSANPDLISLGVTWTL